VCLAQSTILARSGQDYVRRHLTARGTAVATYLAREAATSMGPKGVGALQQLAEQAQAQGGVVYTRFFDARGLLLVAVGKPPPGKTPPPVRSGPAAGDARDVCPARRRRAPAAAEPAGGGPAFADTPMPVGPGDSPRANSLVTPPMGVPIEP